MNIPDGIKKMLKDNKRTQTWLAIRMGYSSPAAIHNMLERGNLTVKTLCRICDELDYEVTIQPKKKFGVRMSSQIVLETPPGGATESD